MTLPAYPPPALATLHDLARCLALVERDELTPLPGGGLHRTSWRVLRAVVSEPPVPRVLAESDVPVSSWLFRSLGAGGLIGLVDGRLRLTRTAYDWLAAPAGEQVAALRQIWLDRPEVACAWLPRPPDRRRSARFWQTLTGQLVANLRALPVDSGVALADLLADLAVQAETVNYGIARNLPRVREAVARQAELLAVFLLTELLPRLAILTLEGTHAERWLALTAEGAAWLHQTSPGDPTARHRPAADAPEPEPPAEAEPEPAAWEISADLRLTIPLAAPPAATFDAMHLADLLTLGPPAIYRVTRASLERALTHGYDLADVRFLLAHGAGRPLSGPVSAQLDRWEEELTVIRYEPGYRLRPLTATRMPGLQEREPFRAATASGASGQWAFVPQPAAAPLIRYLRRSGYVLSPATPGPDNSLPPLLPPLLHRRLPLVPLAVLVGLYGRLRARVPGLADLDLAALEAHLLAALPPAGQAAVARLVASNAALLVGQLDPAATELDAARQPAGPAATESRLQSPAPADIPGLLNTAVAAGTSLTILYADTAGSVTQRRIQPRRLEKRWDRLYVVAYCELRGDERSFRVDRIVEVLGA